MQTANPDLIPEETMRAAMESTLRDLAWFPDDIRKKMEEVEITFPMTLWLGRQLPLGLRVSLNLFFITFCNFCLSSTWHILDPTFLLQNLHPLRKFVQIRSSV